MPLRPASCELTVGVPLQFQFVDAVGTAIPAPPGTTWTANPPTAGDLSATGEFTPRDLSHTPVTITALNAAGSFSAIVHLVRPSITIFPSQLRIKSGERQKFQAVVAGDPSNKVIWSAAQTAEAMVDDEFVAPDSITEPQTIALTAIFPGDPSVTATATIEVIPEKTDWRVVVMLMIYLGAVFSLVVVLASIWPPAPGDSKQAMPIPTWWWGPISPEVDLLWLVLITGALGSFVYSARSFVDFVGNRKFRPSWIPWYLMYPLIGSALALMFYLGIRGGLLTAAARGSDINISGLVAISGLSGMFSKQATNKLNELFTTMFRTDRNDSDLKDKLNPKPKTPAR
jgi:hypothetical protein